MATRKKNSLVENINRRKRKGISRPKSKSTVTKDSYKEMQKGWPHSKRKSAKKKSSNKKSTKKRTKKKAAKKK